MAAPTTSWRSGCPVCCGSQYPPRMVALLEQGWVYDALYTRKGNAGCQMRVLFATPPDKFEYEAGNYRRRQIAVLQTTIRVAQMRLRALEFSDLA